VPDLAGIFGDLGKEMSAFMAKYDERELTVIADYITNTIRVLKTQTAKLTAE
jgi:hypothetical protein